MEATHTHVGNEKPLYFNEIKHLFGKINDKIIHIIVDDFPHKAPNINLNPSMWGEQWVNEQFQRNCIMRGLEKIPDLQGEDIIIITDADEIPDPRLLSHIKNGNLPVTLNRIEMDMYYYNLNTKIIDKWAVGYLGRYDYIINSGTTLSVLRCTRLNEINNGGWHLSYFGDVKFIQNKLQQLAHTEFNGDEYTNESHIIQQVQNGASITYPKVTKKISFKDNDNPPLLSLIYLSTYILY